MLSTFHAAVFLLLQASRIDKRLGSVDWHSFLRENRRMRLTPSSITSGHPKGNSHIFGLIPCHQRGTRTVYSKPALQSFCAHLSKRKDLVDLLAKMVG